MSTSCEQKLLLPPTVQVSQNFSKDVSVKDVSVSESLIPKFIIDGIHTKDVESSKYLGEGHMCAIAMLVVNTVLGALKALKQNNLKALDANPGDGGCQSRAFELRRLKMLDLSEECDALEKETLKVKVLMNKRKSDFRESVKCNSSAFFSMHVESLRVSKEIEYILHCFLSKTLRTPYETLSNGVVMTKSEVSKLSMLSDKISVFEVEHRRKIVEENQKRLSMLSTAAMHHAASQISSLKIEEKKLIVTMLSPEHACTFTPDEQYEPKSFGCLFYQVKTLLVRLKEEQGVACLKSIVPSDRQPFLLFLKPQGIKNEFEVMPEEDCSKLSPKTPVVIFEAVVNGEKEKASELLKKHGFSRTILVGASKEAPYHPGSSLDDVKNQQAVDEINAFRKQGEVIGDFINLDHVYLNTIEAELKVLRQIKV